MDSSSWKSKEMIRLILSIVLLVIGIILLCAPQYSMPVIVLVIGVVVLVYGVIQLLLDLRHRKAGVTTDVMAIPVISIVVGILLIIFRDGVANYILPIIIGAWAVITGIMSMLDGSHVKEYSKGAWKTALISGIIELALGIVIIIGVIAGGNVLGVLLGICLTIYGILSIVGWGTVASASKK